MAEQPTENLSLAFTISEDHAVTVPAKIFNKPFLLRLTAEQPKDRPGEFSAALVYDLSSEEGDFLGDEQMIVFDDVKAACVTNPKLLAVVLAVQDLLKDCIENPAN